MLVQLEGDGVSKMEIAFCSFNGWGSHVLRENFSVLNTSIFFIGRIKYFFIVLYIVGTVFHLVIYMQSNKIHKVILMSKFIHHVC